MKPSSQASRSVGVEAVGGGAGGVDGAVRGGRREAAAWLRRALAGGSWPRPAAMAGNASASASSAENIGRLRIRCFFNGLSPRRGYGIRAGGTRSDAN